VIECKKNIRWRPRLPLRAAGSRLQVRDWEDGKVGLGLDLSHIALKMLRTHDWLVTDQNF